MFLTLGNSRKVDKKLFALAVDDQILLVGSFGRKRGRPRKSILGTTEPKVLDLNIAALIVKSMYEFARMKNMEFTGALTALQDDEFRRGFASKRLAQLSRFGTNEVGADPEDTFRRNCGRIIRVNDRPINSYVTTEFATPMELLESAKVDTAKALTVTYLFTEKSRIKREYVDFIQAHPDAAFRAARRTEEESEALRLFGLDDTDE